ncbi:NAD(+)/NADH kinase [Spiroplasma phoeniceum]|uniref:ATP-NAD kinase n=1 Tax=Spiroplasma phoeniceum P40 TaxID=1276259 RepID=A0A345DRF8_9MOLU|nr:NAD(+)/NADH kinase [Spiroplasma phoeniceum]AXF96799.1 putative ATP-NAD kinase [Spiroplasma phoeniceum P40]
MVKYAIIANDYQESTQLVNKIIKLLQENKLKEDLSNPQYVFIIGGDGTLLRAVNKFQDIIDKVFFIVIKSGSLGFYANYDENTYPKAIKAIINNKVHIRQMPLLEIKYNGNIIRYALNEAKVVDNVKTIRTDIYVNNDLLEHFRGSGLVFATKTGSTGYMRAINGSIIASNISTLWQLKEIAPVANSTFSTINASIILDQDQIIRLNGELKGKSLVIDTYESEILSSDVELKISQKTLNLCYDKENDLSLIAKMKLLFAHCNDNRGDD